MIGICKHEADEYAFVAKHIPVSEVEGPMGTAADDSMPLSPSAPFEPRWCRARTFASDKRHDEDDDRTG